MNDTATTTSAIVVDEVLPHAPAAIWKTLTDSALMGRWLMAPSGFAPVKGTHFSFRTTPAGAWDGTIACRVLEAVDSERLAYTWASGHEGNIGYGAPLETVVTWSLSRAGQGTRVRLVHAGFALPRNDTAYNAMRGGWKQVVQAVGEVTGAGA